MFTRHLNKNGGQTPYKPNVQLWFWSLPVCKRSKSPRAKPEHKHDAEVTTLSPIHFQMTATKTKSAFCALHCMYKISINMLPTLQQCRNFFVFCFV